MTSDEKKQVAILRKEGRSYTEIAQALGISKNTVKTYCRRNDLTGEAASMPEVFIPEEHTEKTCLNCGKPVTQTPGRKEKKFCCDHCRNVWWNSHLALVKRRAMYEFVCPGCGKTFYAYGNRNRKYCSHECYVQDRFGGAACD